MLNKQISFLNTVFTVCPRGSVLAPVSLSQAQSALIGQLAHA